MKCCRRPQKKIKSEKLKCKIEEPLRETYFSEPQAAEESKKSKLLRLPRIAVYYRSLTVAALLGGQQEKWGR